ncbi:MAG: glycoside hydrolase family 31 protein [Clostridiales bacterium]|nr:glycoside hydrolase family 31 protein [Clostridiales bacterium]
MDTIDNMDNMDFKQMDIPKTAHVSSDEIENLYDQYNPNLALQFMKANHILFNVLDRVTSFKNQGNVIDFIVETKKFNNRHFWTHETMLNCLYEEKEENTTLTCFRIALYDESTFRVHYNQGDTYGGEINLDAMPTKMLVGAPNNDVVFDITKDELHVVITTVKMSIRITKEPFNVCAQNNDDEIIFQQKSHETRVSDNFLTSYAQFKDRHAYYQSLELHAGEKIFGLGERFDHVERTGVSVDFWNKDAFGTSSPRTYINIPFYWSTKGYGLFVNTYGHKAWEIGTLDSGTLTFGTDDEYMDYFVICEPNPRDILKKYTHLTGAAVMPPIWSYGLWMSRNSYLSWDVVDDVISDMDQKKIPFDVIHLDTAWFEEDWNCDLKFSKERFGNPAEKIQQLKSEGIYISLWQYNFIPNIAHNKNLIEATERGYLAKGEDGAPYKAPEYVTGSWTDDAVIDFSNPEAAKWYTDQIEELITMGVGAIKTDFAEGIPASALYQNIDGRYFHNYYSLVYNHLIFEAIRNIDPETLVWARSGTAGSQKYPVHWGGDNQCSWGGLAGTLRGLISICMSGIAFFSHDIGGFIGRPTPELYIRWAQLGLFSSHSRCHGSGNKNSREPSSFGQEAVDIFKKYALLRYRLLPYIVSQSEKSVAMGMPLTRGLALAFHEDRGTYAIEDEYMLGDHILVAPVVMSYESSKTRSVYLPHCSTRWAEYYSGDIVLPAGYMEVPSVLDTLPLFVKSDAVIPYGPERLRTHNTLSHIEEIHVYPDFEGVWEYACDGIEISLKVMEHKVVDFKHNQQNTPKILFK